VLSLLGILVFLLIPDVALATKSVSGPSLSKCGDFPKTGYFRDGYCHTGPEDLGTHVACATVTQEFLDFTLKRGNDLITPHPESGFPGLKPGDRWCLCALRWLEADRAGVAPSLDLKATHVKMLEYAPLSKLRQKR
jgi:uncharacterized protein (DUF2237 family)